MLAEVHMSHPRMAMVAVVQCCEQYGIYLRLAQKKAMRCNVFTYVGSSEINVPN